MDEKKPVFFKKRVYFMDENVKNPCFSANDVIEFPL